MKRPASLAPWGLLALAAAVACDVITLPPGLSAPANTCTDSNSCGGAFPEAGAALQCSSGVCVTPSGFQPILVVTTPSNAPVGAGITFGLPGKQPPSGAGPSCGQLGTCIFLTQLLNTTGQLTVSQPLATALVPPGGLRPNVPAGGVLATSLPVRVVFHPAWVDAATGTPMLAATLGLPLSSLETVSQLNPFVLAPPPTNGVKDVQGGEAFELRIPGGFTLADTSLGNYIAEIIPTEPYSMFPPRIEESARAGSAINLDYALPSPGSLVNLTTYTLQTQPGAPDLAGWTAYAVDAHGFRITGNYTLTGTANEQIPLYDATHSLDQTNQRLYLQPPPGVALPTYVDPAVSGLLQRTLVYPGLPPQVTVSGPVHLATDLTRIISARIVFVADGGSDGAAVATTDINAPFNTQLYYRAETTTNTSGQYQITLPPGKYRTYVIPNDPDLALTIALSTITAGGNGREIVVEARHHLRGRAELGDGTPLYGATVAIEPSPDAPLDPKSFDALALPRESIGETDASGQFDVLVDPGTVDISVRPHPGSHYPWVVTTNWKLLTDTTLPKTIVIPPPGDPATTRSGGLLVDALGNPLTRTAVRAYGFPAAGAPVADGGLPTSRAARLVGMTVTDDKGAFALYLAPPDP